MFISIIETTASAVVGGIATGYLLKLLDRRRVVPEAVQLELAKTFVLEHFEAIKTMKGEFNQIAHELRRADLSPERYHGEILARRAESIRELARARAAILGQPAVSRVHELT